MNEPTLSSPVTARPTPRAEGAVTREIAIINRKACTPAPRQAGSLR